MKKLRLEILFKYTQGFLFSENSINSLHSQAADINVWGELKILTKKFQFRKNNYCNLVKMEI